MKRYSDVLIADGHHQFRCPGCQSNWEYPLARHVLKATMSADQLTHLDIAINDNLMNRSPRVKNCPSCTSFCQRLQPNNNRVVCQICTAKKRGARYEFCWQCLMPWVGGGVSCRNLECSGVDSRYKHLQTCDTKTIGQVSGVPSVRCCVECGMLINHIDKCKHMACNCGYSFCFVCLKPQIKDTGKWQCGISSEICAVAPRQTKLPF